MSTSPAQAAPLEVDLPLVDSTDVVIDETHGHIFIAGGQSNKVLITDLAGNVVRSIAGGYPSGVAMQPDGAHVWVSIYTDRRILKVDTETLKTVASIDVAPSYPLDVAVTDDRVIYADGDSVSWFDMTNPANGDSLSIYADTVDVSPANPDMAVVGDRNSTGTFAVVDLTTGIKTNELVLPGQLVSFAVRPQGGEVVMDQPDAIGPKTFSLPGLVESTIYETLGSADALNWNATGTHLIATTFIGLPANVWVFRRGSSKPVFEFEIESDEHPSRRSAVISADASTIWVVTADTHAGTATLHRHSTAPTGRITGRVTASDGNPMSRGIADVFDWETGAHVAGAPIDGSGSYAFEDLEPGTYMVLGSNSDETTFYDYFPEWYRDAPIFLFDRVVPVVVKSGETVEDVNFVLDPFYDDMFDTTFTADIAWMRGTSLTTGCGGNSYCPEDYVTRGQMAAFLVRALDLEASNPSFDFDDDDNSVFEADIERLATAGITTGCMDDRFCPDDLVTRGQMAAFLVRSMGYSDRGNVDFTDDNASVFEADIERLATAGVTTGCDTGLFCPDDYVTRGQMAAFLHRALGGGTLYPGSDGGSFSVVSRTVAQTSAH